MNFGIIILNQNIKKVESYIDTDSFIIHIKTGDFYIKILQEKKMIHQIIKLIHHYHKE